MIVFILGGATYSEARVGYEVSNDKSPSWEVIVGTSSSLIRNLITNIIITIGGDTPVLTPEVFLQNVGNLDSVHGNPFI